VEKERKGMSVKKFVTGYGYGRVGPQERAVHSVRFGSGRLRGEGLMGWVVLGWERVLFCVNILSVFWNDENKKKISSSCGRLVCGRPLIVFLFFFASFASFTTCSPPTPVSAQMSSNSSSLASPGRSGAWP